MRGRQLHQLSSTRIVRRLIADPFQDGTKLLLDQTKCLGYNHLRHVRREVCKVGSLSTNGHRNTSLAEIGLDLGRRPIKVGLERAGLDVAQTGQSARS